MRGILLWPQEYSGFLGIEAETVSAFVRSYALLAGP
jgi:hypothetical protein